MEGDRDDRHRQPSTRGAHGAVAVGDRMYVFGGFFERDDQQFDTNDSYVFYNDLYYLDNNTKVWTALTPSGPRPDVRAFHRLMVDDSAGIRPASTSTAGRSAATRSSAGATRSRSSYGDVWRYDTGANTWTELNPTCPAAPAPCAPGARLGMAGEMNDGKIYIFGGIDANFATLGDTWRFDVQTKTWTQLTPTCNVPTARATSRRPADMAARW